MADPWEYLVKYMQKNVRMKVRGEGGGLSIYWASGRTA